jgi:hypothetical protein
LSLALAVGLGLVTVETVSARRRRQHAERPIAPRVERSVLLTVPSPSAPSLPLEPALPVYKPSPINSVGDRVPSCLRSFAFNAGFGDNPTIAPSTCAPCVNN